MSASLSHLNHLIRDGDDGRHGHDYARDRGHDYGYDVVEWLVYTLNNSFLLWCRTLLVRVRFYEIAYSYPRGSNICSKP